MRKTVLALLAVFFVFSVVVASANVSTVPAGGKAECNRASWVIENQSESKETTVHINMGTLAYSWTKNFDRTLPPLRKHFGINYKRLNLRTILKKGIHNFGSVTVIMM